MWVGELGMEIRGVLEREGGGLGGWERRGGCGVGWWGRGRWSGGWVRGTGVVRGLWGGWGVRWWCGVEWCKWEEVKEDRCGC